MNDRGMRSWLLWSTKTSFVKHPCDFPAPVCSVKSDWDCTDRCWQNLTARWTRGYLGIQFSWKKSQSMGDQWFKWNLYLIYQDHVSVSRFFKKADTEASLLILEPENIRLPFHLFTLGYFRIDFVVLRSQFWNTKTNTEVVYAWLTKGPTRSKHNTPQTYLAQKYVGFVLKKAQYRMGPVAFKSQILLKLF